MSKSGHGTCGCHIKSDRTALNPAPTPRTPCDEGQHTYEHDFRQDRVISACRGCAKVVVSEIGIATKTLADFVGGDMSVTDRVIPDVISHLTKDNELLTGIKWVKVGFKDGSNPQKLNCPCCGSGEYGEIREIEDLTVVCCSECHSVGTLKEFSPTGES